MVDARPLSGVRIRSAGPEDAPLIATLIEELNADQREPVGHVTADAVRRDGFGDEREFSVLLAEAEGSTLGYVLYHPTWATETGERGLYVYDLYVRLAARGRGVGRALLAAVAAEARRQGRSFLWWSSKEWNAPAQAFYAGLGAEQETVRSHAVSGEAFARLAGEGAAS